MHEELVESIKNRKAILFVGSGVSALLGLPTWAGLIDHMANELGYDSDVFKGRSENYYTLAEYYKLVKATIGPLRSWMDVNWKIDDEKIKKSKVHELIINLDFPIIYTTNYDRNIEKAYQLQGRECNKIVNVRDISAMSENKTQIIKFHGDFDEDDSIVLTESDYFDRLSFESALDIKLRADVLGKTILFIGYSLSDINIRLLLYKLRRIWKSSRNEQHQPKSYIFLTEPNLIQQRVLENWGVQTIIAHEDNPENALITFLETILKMI